jgi:hypothetical protein
MARFGKGERNILFREEIQFLKKSHDMDLEPPYGVLILTDREMILASEGERIAIPFSSIMSIDIGYRQGADLHSHYSKSHITVNYKESGKETHSPAFSSASGMLGATLSGARDKRTHEVFQDINRHLSEYSPKKEKPKAKEKKARGKRK